MKYRTLSIIYLCLLCNDTTFGSDRKSGTISSRTPSSFSGVQNQMSLMDISDLKEDDTRFEYILDVLLSSENSSADEAMAQFHFLIEELNRRERTQEQTEALNHALTENNEELKAKLKNEKEKYNKFHSAIQRKSDEAKAKYNQLQKENQESIRKLAAEKEKGEKAEEEIQSLQKSIEQYKKELVELQAKLELSAPGMQKQIEELKEKQDELTEQLQKQKLEKDELTKQLQNQKEDFDAQARDFQTSIEKLKKDKSDKSQQLESLKNENQKQNQRLKALNDDKASLQQRLNYIITFMKKLCDETINSNESLYKQLKQSWDHFIACKTDIASKIVLYTEKHLSLPIELEFFKQFINMGIQLRHIQLRIVDQYENSICGMGACSISKDWVLKLNSFADNAGDKKGNEDDIQLVVINSDKLNVDSDDNKKAVESFDMNHKGLVVRLTAEVAMEKRISELEQFLSTEGVDFKKLPPDCLKPIRELFSTDQGNFLEVATSVTMLPFQSEFSQLPQEQQEEYIKFMKLMDKTGKKGLNNLIKRMSSDSKSSEEKPSPMDEVD